MALQASAPGRAPWAWRAGSGRLGYTSAPEAERRAMFVAAPARLTPLIAEQHADCCTVYVPR